MMVHRSIFGLLLFAIAVFAEDKCSGPFTQFMKCLLTEVDGRLQSYQQESSSSVQSSIGQCFSQASCEVPQFSNAKVDYFFPEPWSSRVKKILALVEDMDPRVQRCLVENMKGVVVKKIDECVQKYGSSDIKDFKVPPLPEMRNLDVTRLKDMVLNRMVVWNATLKCGKSKSDDAGLQSMLNCVSNARGGKRSNMCTVREKCKTDNIDASCSARYESVKNALCTCSKEEAKNFKSSVISKVKSMKEYLFQVLDQSVRQCYKDNNVAFPEDKYSDAKKALGEAILDVAQQGKVPEALMDAITTVSGSMRDLVDEWRHAFCSDCTPGANGTDQSSSANVDAKRVREALARQQG